MRSLIRRSAPTKAAPRDPAPSKLGYRYQRLMLTPGFRVFTRVGVPILLIAAILSSWFSHEENRLLVRAQIDGAKETFQTRPQFMVHGIQITGAEPSLQSEVAALITYTFPASSFDLDLEKIRDDVEGLEAVRAASVRVGQGGILELAVSPRVPAALWRDGNTLRLIDGGGVQAGVVSARADRLDLPLIAGDGAEKHIGEALALYNGAGPLRERVRGLLRMGERRWDIILDRDQRIMLPAENSVAALDRIVALNQAQDMLERDVAVVDMRNSQRPTLRMSDEAALAMRRANEIKISDEADD